MTGTLINVAAILLGGMAGLLFGARIPEKARHTIVAGLGLFTLTLGVDMAIEADNPLVVLGSLLIGAVIGETLGLEERLELVGDWLEQRFRRMNSAQQPGSRDLFIRGYVTASLVFCVGPIAILGSFQDGLSGDIELLAIKSVLDGFASIAFAASLGPGVLFSALSIFIYQGLLTLGASQAQAFLTEAMIAAMTSTGGVILVAVAVSSLLELKKIRVASFLPALLLAPIIQALANLAG